MKQVLVLMDIIFVVVLIMINFACFRYAEVVNFHNVSQLLRKDSGLRVQKQAVHLVYLLLNCKFALLCVTQESWSLPVIC